MFVIISTTPNYLFVIQNLLSFDFFIVSNEIT